MIKSEVLNETAKLRELSLVELRAANLQLKEQQMKLRMQHAIGQVEKTHLVREARRQRARVLTLIKEKLLHGDTPAHVSATPAAPVASEGAEKSAAKPATKKAGKPAVKKIAKPAAKKPAKPAAKKTAKPAAKKPAAKKAAKKK